MCYTKYNIFIIHISTKSKSILKVLDYEGNSVKKGKK